MRWWLCFTLLLGLPLATPAQQASAEAADAAEHWQQIRQRLGPATLSSGQFEQQRELARLDWPLISRGRFAHWPDGALHWLIESPIYAEIRIRDEQLQQRDAADAAWQTPPMGEQAGPLAAQLLSGLLRADIDTLSEYFELRSELSQESWQLQLQPRQQAMAQWIDYAQVSGDDKVRSLQIVYRSGESLQIQLQHAVPAALSEAQQQAMQD